VEGLESVAIGAAEGVGKLLGLLRNVGTQGGAGELETSGKNTSSAVTS